MEVTANTATDSGQVPDLPRESSSTSTVVKRLFSDKSFENYSITRHFSDTKCASCDAHLSRGQQVEYEDENSAWAKVVVMQLRKLSPYAAARLRLRLDTVIVDATKPSDEAWEHFSYYNQNNLNFLRETTICFILKLHRN